MSGVAPPEMGCHRRVAWRSASLASSAPGHPTKECSNAHFHTARLGDARRGSPAPPRCVFERCCGVGEKLALTNAEQCTVLAGAAPGCTPERGSAEALMRLVTEHTFIRSGSDATY